MGVSPMPEHFGMGETPMRLNSVQSSWNPLPRITDATGRRQKQSIQLPGVDGQIGVEQLHRQRTGVGFEDGRAGALEFAGPGGAFGRQLASGQNLIDAASVFSGAGGELIEQWIAQTDHHQY